MRRILTLMVAAGLAAACGRTPREPAAAPSGEWRSFAGTWTAEGERRSIDTGAGRQASIVEVSGSILLTGERGLGVGFLGRAITWSDGDGSSVGRAIWTDESGDAIFSELSGAELATGRHVTGRLTGGTGRWAGITGDYALDWKIVLDVEGRVQGRAEALRGRARIVPPQGAAR